MNKISWIVAIATAVVFAGGGVWGGMSYGGNQKPSYSGGNFASRGATGATFVARGGASATIGTVLSVGNGSVTIQLPTSTSTTAQTGSKIVLYDASTQIEEMQNVAPSALKAGQNLIVSGGANSDGSITASSIQIRPAGGTRSGAPMIPAGQ